jgi:3-deoxy-D-manno-octulosonic-acid transferase
MKWFYNIGIQFYALAIRLAALFQNKKAQKWLVGRKDVFQRLKQVEASAIWVHAASLGEFEQGRPMIEAIKAKNPNQKILLTFFSPSGYEIRKDYPLADYVFYLPMDSPKNAKRFIRLTKPKMAIFIKYEFWYYYINELHLNQIPIYSVSAIFRPHQIYFKWYGAWFKQILMKFNHIFVQNQASLLLLKANGLANASVAGDTRMDRVQTIAKEAKSFPIVQAFTNQQPTLICGSTWQEDEKIIAEYILHSVENSAEKLPFKIILAPHDIQEKHIKTIEKLFQPKCKTLRYSQANSEHADQFDLLIIDNIGMLSSLYRYGTIAYIGGGLGKGLHNTLEPIAFRLPVIFGNKKYQKFEEAICLAGNGGGFPIGNMEDFKNIIKKLQNQSFLDNASALAFKYMEDNQGATDKIFQKIFSV